MGENHTILLSTHILSEVEHSCQKVLIINRGRIVASESVTDLASRMGGAEATSRFARLFLAPGVGHCGGGPGPAPAGQFDAVVRWVEQGQAPETLNAVRRDSSGTTRTRQCWFRPCICFTGIATSWPAR